MAPFELEAADLLGSDRLHGQFGGLHLPALPATVRACFRAPASALVKRFIKRALGMKLAQPFRIIAHRGASGHGGV
jgi:hypothetical protein